MPRQHEFRDVPSQYHTCRAWGHAWEFTTVDRSGADYIQGLRCSRCKTHRAVRISTRTGFREGNSYKYPEQLDHDAAPYQLPKGTGGALTMEERASITLGEIQSRYTATTDEVAKRRRRRRA